MVDIDLVDASRVNCRNCPSQGMFADAFGQDFAPISEQQFGIAQATNSITGIQYYSRRDNRSKE